LTSPKEKQALKLAEIREALVTAAAYNTTAKQAAVLGLGRSTAWWLLNHDKRAGPSAKVIKRVLLSSQVPKKVRRKIEQYVEEKVRGLYGHCEQRAQWFSEQFQRSPNPLMRGAKRRPLSADQMADTRDDRINTTIEIARSTMYRFSFI
jgi:hypothetical protein